MDFCTIDGCSGAATRDRSTSAPICEMHYCRRRRNGSFENLPPVTRLIHSEGFIIVKADGHPLADHQGWVYEHRKVLFEAIGQGTHPCHWCEASLAWEVSLKAARLNNDKADNRPSNLVPACWPCVMSYANSSDTCKAGLHAWSDGYFRLSRKGHRECLACRRARPRTDKHTGGHKRRALSYGVQYEEVNRLEVYERDDWVCGLCRFPVDRTLPWPNPFSASLDHIVPLSLGGGHLWNNVQCSHLRCNITKGNRLEHAEAA